MKHFQIIYNIIYIYSILHFLNANIHLAVMYGKNRATVFVTNIKIIKNIYDSPQHTFMSPVPLLMCNHSTCKSPPHAWIILDLIPPYPLLPSLLHTGFLFVQQIPAVLYNLQRLGVHQCVDVYIHMNVAGIVGLFKTNSTLISLLHLPGA